MSRTARASLLALQSLLLSLLVALPASALAAAPATADAEPPGLAPATQGSRLLHVTGGGTSFAVRVPGRSVSTFTWDPDDPGVVTHHLTAAGGTSLVSRVAAQDAPPAVASAPDGSLPVVVDPTETHQRVDGFGGALTHSAAVLVDDSPRRAEILDALFGDDGARLSLVRLPVGASDLVAEPWESYADDPVRRLRSFSLARDRAHAVPLLRAAQRRNPDLRLMATPWSAPAWLKRGGTFTGSCTGKKNMLKVRAYRTYARYLTRYAARYDAMGLPLWTLGLQNEPGLCRTSYPTMTMTAGQQARLATVLRRRLDAAGQRDVAILAHDHNWYDDGATLADGPTTVPEQVLARTDAVDAIGYHCYGSGGDPTPWATQTTLAPVHMTECSGFLDHADAGANLVHEVRHDLIGPLRHSARSAFYWSLALGDDGGPHVGGCATCRGMVGIDRAGGAWSPNEDLAYWSQLSRFVDPGAVRIGSTEPGSSVETVAFRNPDGRLVLVVLDAAATGNYRGHLVRDAADTSAHPASWLVGVDGRRRWVPDGATWSCLKAAGVPGSSPVAGGTLAVFPEVAGVPATCGTATLPAVGMLQRGASLRSDSGDWLLRLTEQALTVVSAADPTQARATTGVGGDALHLRPDGDLVLLRAGAVVWRAGTAGTGAVVLRLDDDGTVRLLDDAGQVVWTS